MSRPALQHRPSLPTTVAAALALLPVMLLAAGCGRSAPEPHRPLAGPLPKPGERQIVLQGGLSTSSEENRPAEDAVLGWVRAAMAAGVPAELIALARRWPDVTLDLLRGVSGSDAARPDIAAVAEAYDAVHGVTDPAAGWAEALRRQAADVEGYAPVRRMLRRLPELLCEGRPAEAADAGLVKALPAAAPGALRADMLRMSGAAALLAERPTEAVRLWREAVTALGGGSSHQRMELLLLISEGERRAGAADAAGQAWTAAVRGGASVRDPGLWDRAVAQRPPAAEWPVELTEAWRAPVPANVAGSVVLTRTAVDDGAVPPAGTAPTDADVLYRVGRMRLARGSLQAALLSFSRAEHAAGRPALKAEARLYRAQTLAGLQQVSAALPMLESLASDPDPRVGRRAQAVLGELLCRTLQDRRRGMPLLREAVATVDGGEWPGKSVAMANLGVCCVLEGKDDEGLKWLAEARTRMEAHGDWPALADALKNEAAVFRALGRDADADASQRRADEICRRHGLPVGPLQPRDARASNAPTDAKSAAARP